MNGVEFLGYTATPNDKFVLGFSTIRLTLKDDRKVIVRHKKVKSKNGGDFFCSASFCKEDMGDKKYYSAFEFDSRTDDEMFREMIQKKSRESEPSAHVAPAQGGFDDSQCPF